MVEFHEVEVQVEGSTLLVECATIELTPAEKAAYLKFWMDGVK